MAEHHSREDEVAVRIALALDCEVATGDKPELAEILAWHRGELDSPRAEEVLAHIARDPECYQLWYELRQAEQESIPELKEGSPGQSLSDRLAGWLASLLSPVPTLAAASVAVVALLAVVIWPLYSIDPLSDPLGESIDRGYAQWTANTIPRPEETLWGELIAADTIASRGTVEDQTGDAGVVKAGLRSGIRSGLGALTSLDPTWKPVIKSLSDDETDCDVYKGAGDCRKLKDTMHQAGRWALLVHFNCLVTASDSPVGMEQGETIRKLLEAGADTGASIEVMDVLAELQLAAADGNGSFCPQVEELLSIAVRAE